MLKVEIGYSGKSGYGYIVIGGFKVIDQNYEKYPLKYRDISPDGTVSGWKFLEREP